MDILKLFQYNQKMKFVDIEKALKVRSNKLAYHLKSLTKKGILVKQNNYYFLSETSEHMIPYLSEKSSVLPVILIHIGDNKNCFLYKRTKRPYSNLLSLPGGRILLGESLEQATKRIMKEKFNMNVKLKKINSVSLEHVKKNKRIIHSFLLIFIKATTNDKISLVDIQKSKNKIISSDYKLIKSSDSEININTIYSRIK
jgi:ADP-ribose pyrophosphatase YjhB (NUDIX family)